MRVSVTLAALTLLIVPAIARGEGNSSNVPILLARFSTDTSPARTLYLYSEQKLQGIHVWLNDQWVEANKEDYLHEGTQYNLYRVSQQFNPSHGNKLSVNSWTPSGTQTFRHELHVRTSEDDFVIAATLKSTRTRDEYLAEKRRFDEQRRQRYADPYGFIVLLNQYRASIGLGPVVHDAGLSRDAQINNSMGSPHAYMGAAMVQNWAYGFSDASGVLRGWQTSPGHNQNLLSPNITRGGIAFSNAEWTFNGN